MEKINYYLVLEKRLGDYNLIDINKLDICQRIVSVDIADIDNFTRDFTEEEIRAAITRSNMAQNDYLDGKLKIVSDVKHNLRVLTKDVFTSIMEFQTNNNEIEQNLKNKLFGLYKKLVESNFNDRDFIKGLLERFKNALKNNNKYEIFNILAELPYNRSRSIYMKIYSEINPEVEISENKQEIQNREKSIEFSGYHAKRSQENQRILEKLNDVA